MNRLDRLLDSLSGFMRAIAAAAIVCMALLTGADVIGRAWGHPIFGSEEIVTILAVVAIAFALPYAHAQNSHIGVEIFIRNLPRRTRERIRFATNIVALLFFAIVTWRLTLYAMKMHESGELSMNLELPEYMVVFAAAAGCGIFVLQILRDVIAFFGANGREG